ncbi:MAG: 3-dehydroquinate synthase [Oscillospiraceae bacterium]|nr:3-dehydroquinate synthase [Oscillospiraceae bacterium]
MKTIKVTTGRPYDVRIAPGLLLQVGPMAREIAPSTQKAAIITDRNVEPLYLEPVFSSLEGAGFETINYSIPPGEASKRGESYLALLGWLAEQKLTRTDLIIALGGGVVGDLAGFAAATYLRGVRYIQLPTSLLAMVDSSVGGKTAIDLPAGKNLAGAFYQPALVLCDTNALSTLPEEVFRDGTAEVIKYGMLCSPTLLEELRGDGLRTQSEGIITQCISIKRDIVCEDEFDTGLRMLLNFGHTIGHGVEKLSGYAISHGLAVAIGMAIDTRSAVKNKLCPPDCLTALEELLALYGLPDKTEFLPTQLYGAALSDKKRAGNEITFVTPRKLGHCELISMPMSEMLDWIEAGVSL